VINGKVEIERTGGILKKKDKNKGENSGGKQSTRDVRKV